jgi:amino acid permease
MCLTPLDGYGKEEEIRWYRIGVLYPRRRKLIHRFCKSRTKYMVGMHGIGRNELSRFAKINLSLSILSRQGAALLTADCLGTGILALPRDIKVLGRGLGVGFLLLNLPINLYAGTLLSDAAGHVERQHDESGEESEQKSHDEMGKLTASSNVFIETTYDSIQHENEPNSRRREHADHDTATFDFIGMTSILFHEKEATTLVMILFYTNIFLVLGNYILVMSHAVSSIFGGMCIPEAGLIASILMFAVSQLRTMAKLGRSASIISLLALFIVVLQCLYYVNQDWSPDKAPQHDEGSDDSSLLRKLSAMGSIGFAVGSQKLFLNIRHEIADRYSAPKSLALSLSSFGTFYVAIVLSAGSNPPGFLFDAIPTGYSQRIGGFFLWIHVVVSYAINSQAICSSMDRIFFHKWQPVTSLSDDSRW